MKYSFALTFPLVHQTQRRAVLKVIA